MSHDKFRRRADRFGIFLLLAWPPLVFFTIFLYDAPVAGLWSKSLPRLDYWAGWSVLVYPGIWIGVRGLVWTLSAVGRSGGAGLRAPVAIVCDVLRSVPLAEAVVWLALILDRVAA